MKKMHKIIILFSVLFIYVLAIILVPVIAKKMHKPNRYYGHIIYSENVVDDKTIDNIIQNRFVMYVDYEDDKIDYYKQYINLEYEIYLSIYTLSDFDNYNSDLFKGVFIKNNDEALINYAKEKKLITKLLINNKNDYDKYNKDVDELIFAKDIIDEMANKYPKKYFYTYLETNNDNLED
ncbi:MAG: hypothetical protein K6E87_03075, partial [bacterium]|nr:hypothetical protein [bacterium]